MNIADDDVSECFSYLQPTPRNLAVVRLVSSRWATVMHEMPDCWNVAYTSRGGENGGHCLLNVSSPLGQGRAVELEITLSNEAQLAQLVRTLQAASPRLTAHGGVTLKLVLIVDVPSLLRSFLLPADGRFDWPAVTVDLRFSRGVSDAALASCLSEGADGGHQQPFGRSITSLNASRSRSLTDDGLEILTRRLRWSALEVLDVSVMNRRFSHAALKSIASITSLKSLRLRELDDDALGVVVISSCHLTALDVTDCHALTDDGIRCLAANAPSLQSLKMKDCRQLTDTALVHVATLSSLTLLAVNGKNYTDGGFACLQRLEKLEALDLEQCFGLSDSSLAGIAGAMKGSLRVLNLSQCGKLTDASLVSGIGNLTHLQHLNLSMCRISDSGLMHLAPLDQLQSLLLSGCVLASNLGVAAALQRKRSMRILNLSQCTRVSDEGLVGLSEMLHLESLDISGLDVTDATLARLTNASRLRYLYVRCCDQISDCGIAHLRGLRHVEFVDVGGCSRVTTSGQEALSSTVTFAL